MSIIEWAFDSVRARERVEENRRAAVARDQVRAMRRHKRRDIRMRVAGWCRQNKMAVYPVGAVAAFTTGLFTVGLLAGFVTLGLGLLALEWRFSR
jgi:hypothetical protein